MKKTLFRQLLMYLVLFGVILSLLSYLFIELFFDDYYFSRQTNVLKENTVFLVDSFESTGLNTFLNKAEELRNEKGMSIHLYNPSSQTLFGSDTQSSGRQNLIEVFNNNETDVVFISVTGGQNSGVNWLTYILETNDSYLVMGRISYANMESVVEIVQRFLLIFGIVLGIIFIIFAYFFSRSMSKPLIKLNEIAKRMEKLDFSMKYTGNRKDEIGNLGQTLNSLTANLENTISQLKKELAKEKTLEKMRTSFTAQVSHELQTPLSVIRGYSEALADRIYTTAETDEVYETMLNETKKISRLVDDLLDLSQMESGAYVIRKKDFSLSDLLNKLYQTHSKLPNTKHFTFEFLDNCKGKSMVFGDSLRLEQALRNIIGNAVKYVSDNGKIIFTLSELSDTCQIQIFNTGDKIPEKDINEIFNSYYQSENHREGTGLGLAITRHIILLHGGSIFAANHDTGVEITINLPKQ